MAKTKTKKRSSTKSDKVVGDTLVPMRALTTIDADDLGPDARHPYAGADSDLRIQRVPRFGVFKVPESDAIRLVEARRADRINPTT